jgi:protein-S-isoprenylcysteine O-methyltransferase Ste14
MPATDNSNSPATASPRTPPPGIWPLLNAAYAVMVYVLFLAVLAYTIGFLADRGVPKGIDGGTQGPARPAAVIDALLLSLFAAQHTVMARPWFKRRWARAVPAPAERTTFVLSATLVLALLYWQWRPINTVVWHMTGPAAGVLLAVNVGGWALIIGSTFMVSHADLFGLRQAYLNARHGTYTPPAFSRRGLYRVVRHPLMAGFVIVFWAAPKLTAGHLLFATAATAYILVGIRFEEHDLAQQFGQTYHLYRASVPALFPIPRKSRQAPREREGL